MKMKWWGWIGVVIALWASSEAYKDLLGMTTPAVSEGQGLAEIGKGIQLFVATLPRLAAGWMIWKIAQK